MCQTYQLQHKAEMEVLQPQLVCLCGVLVTVECPAKEAQGHRSGPAN